MRHYKPQPPDGATKTVTILLAVFLVLPLLAMMLLSGSGVINNPQDWSKLGVWTSVRDR